MFTVRLAGGHLYGKQLFTWLSLVVSLVVSFMASFMASFVLSFFPLDVLDGTWDHKEGTCKVSGRWVMFAAFYADFCLCPKSVIITTLTEGSYACCLKYLRFLHKLLS